VNTLGKVAFVPELDVTFDQGLVVSSKTGTFGTRYLRSDGQFNGTLSRVSLKEVGQIAFPPGFFHGGDLSLQPQCHVHDNH
jgi:hypothetical protein